jgi:hypothetical protein
MPIHHSSSRGEGHQSSSRKDKDKKEKETSTSTRQPTSGGGRVTQLSRTYQVQGSIMPKLDYGSSRVPDAPSTRREPTKASSSSRRPQTQASSSGDQVTSAFKTSYDEKMASRQTRIASLAPKERQEQEAWAQSQLKTNAGACMAGWDWVRTEKCGGLTGYRCKGRGHFVTDGLLAHGDQKCYLRDGDVFEATGIVRWMGPLTREQLAAQIGMTVPQYKVHMAQVKGEIEALQRIGMDPFAEEAEFEAQSNPGFNPYSGGGSRFPPGRINPNTGRPFR